MAFGQFCTVKEVRLFAAQNFGFVVLGDKAQATQAILGMHGRELDLGVVGGKCKVRVKWGKPIQQGSGAAGRANQLLASANEAGAVVPVPNLQFPQSALLALSQQSSARLIQQQQQELALAAAMARQQQQQSMAAALQPLFQGGGGGGCAGPVVSQQQQQQHFQQQLLLSAAAQFGQQNGGPNVGFCGQAVAAGCWPLAGQQF